MAEILSAASFISYIAAVAFGAVAIALWFLFKIPSVIGDLSGRNAKKSIEKMRSQDSIDKKNQQRLQKKKKEKRKTSQETGLLHSEGTRFVKEQKETELLENEGTNPLDVGKATELLEEQDQNNEMAAKRPSVEIRMLEDVVLVHTDETI